MRWADNEDIILTRQEAVAFLLGLFLWLTLYIFLVILRRFDLTDLLFYESGWQKQSTLHRHSVWNSHKAKLRDEEDADALHDKSGHGPSRLSEEVDMLLTLITTEFVTSWFKKINASDAFTNCVKRNLRYTVSRIHDRVSDVSAANVVVLHLFPLIISHLKSFDKAEASVRGPRTSNALTDSVEVEFAIARIYNNGSLYPGSNAGVSDVKLERHKALRRMCRRIVPMLLSPNEHNSETVVCLVTEILACSVLEPVIALLSDPDTVNQLIVKFSTSLIKERRHVRRLRALLQHHTRKTEKSLRRKRIALLKPHESESKYQHYLEYIKGSATLSELRRMRNQISVQLAQLDQVRNESSATSASDLIAYSNRLRVAHDAVVRKIAVLSKSEKGLSLPLRSDQSNADIRNLKTVLNNSSDLSHFMEFMDRRSRIVPLQFWLVVNGLRDPLEEYNTNDNDTESYDGKVVAHNFDDKPDIDYVRSTYFDNAMLRIDRAIKDDVRNYIESQRYDHAQHLQARKALFEAQSQVFALMEREDFPAFLNSEIYLRLLASHTTKRSDIETAESDQSESKEGASPNLAISADSADAGILDDLQPLDEDDIVEAVDSALNDYVQEGNDQADYNRDGNLPETDPYRQDMPEDSRPSTAANVSHLSPVPAESDDEDGNRKIASALPGDLAISESIQGMDDSMNDLIQQEVLAEKLLQKAELTNNVRESRLLQESLRHIQLEKKFVQSQRDHYSNQERENDIYGRSRISLSASVSKDAEGNEFVVYIIEVQRLNEDGTIAAGWLVGRRYSEFYELHKSLKAKYDIVGSLHLPPKRVMMKLQKSFIEGRRQELEHYLRKLLQYSDVYQSKELRLFLSQHGPPIGEGSRSTSKPMRASLERFNGFLKEAYKGGARSKFHIRRHAELKSSSEMLIADSGELDSSIENETLFVRRLIDLFLEIFELDKNYSWVNPKVVIVFLQHLFGGAIEKESISRTETEAFAAEAVKGLTALMWPEGQFVKSPPARTEEEKSNTAIEAKIFLTAIFPSYLPDGVAQKLFRLAQNQSLNAHLLLSALDILLGQIFSAE